MRNKIIAAVLFVMLSLPTAGRAQDVAGAIVKINEALALLQQPPTISIPVANAQQAIDAAPAGAILVLDSTATYPALMLTGEGKTLTSSTQTSGRQSPNAQLPKVLHLDVTGHDWTIRGIEVTGATNRVESVWCDPSADNIVFDQLLIRGHDEIRRGIAANCSHAAVTRSYIYNFGAPGVESQAIATWEAVSFITVIDNYLEAASENAIIGGESAVPADVYYARNTLSKPAAWRAAHRNVKNLFEVKAGRRVTFEDNTLDGSWVDGQVGYGIVLTVRNQNGDCTQCTIEDLIVRRNVLMNVGACFQILGTDYTHPSQRGNNWLLDANVCHMAPRSSEWPNESPSWDAGRFLFVNDGPTNLTVTNNKETIVGDANSFLTFSTQNLIGFTFSGNEVHEGDYGIFAEGAPGLGVAALNYAAPSGCVWGTNIVHLGTSGRVISYPAGTIIQ